MRKWKQALALVLALVMALSLVALPSFAADEDSTGTGTTVTGGSTNTPGLELRKVYDPSTGQLTLEAYATGSTTTTTSTEPVDIILVLDVSGSMDDPISSSWTHNPVYSVSSNGTYYYQANGQYQRAYYCDGNNWYTHKDYHDPGWYTEDHQSDYGNCLGETGARLTPKTSASDADTGHTQFYEYGQLTKIDALKSAVNGFIDSVAAKSADSQIAIVKFAGDKTDRVGNDTYQDQEDGYTYNYSQIVRNLTTVDATGAGALKTAVSALHAAGATAADYGMQHAQTIITGAANDGRKKVVVMFTDGEPNHDRNFDSSVANSAISASKSMKDAGATVYTIGCFSQNYAENTNVGKYMRYVSSNYPNAASMSNAGTKASDNFYKTVGSTADLDAIFQEISQTAGGATLTLGSETVLRDVVSAYFDLPENAAGSITARSYSCTGFDANGAPTWSDTPDQGTNYAVSIQDKTISVTGFDYSENWVGKDTTTGVAHTPGKKLVVTIPVVDNGTGMGTVPTNGTESAVYDKEGKLVCAFAQPTAYFPYFTVVHRQSAVNDAGKNYGKDGGSTKHRVPTDGTKFDLTSVVTGNYLYGGSFTDENCDTVQPYSSGENPMAFTPVDKATYYIWEVPNTYLVPRNYYVWRHLPENGGKETVVRLYPLTTADRTLYKQVGFVIDGTDHVSGCGEFGTALDAAPTLYQTAVAMKNGQHYQTVYLRNGTIQATDTAIENELVNGQHIDEGCLAGIRLGQNEWTEFTNTGVTFRPYWITLDNVKVCGATARTCTYVEGQQTPRYNDNTTSVACEYVGDQVTTQAMSYQAVLQMDDSQVQPPVDDRITVTVNDGGNSYEVKVQPGEAVSLTPAGQDGRLFAGWYVDGQPSNLGGFQTDTTVTAKYVSSAYLTVKYTKIGLFRVNGISLVSAVDSRSYQETGFIINGDKVVVNNLTTRYHLFYTAGSLFSGVERNAPLMAADYSLRGARGNTVTVTPYWVTADGTTVQGATRTLSYNAWSIWG